MGRIERRLHDLVNGEREHRREIDQAHQAVIGGTGTLADYRLVAGKDAKKQLKAWIPTLPLSAARHGLGLPAGRTTGDRPRALARRVARGGP